MLRPFPLSPRLTRGFSLSHPSFAEKPFAHSVPAYTSHLVLHSAVPPKDWPARFDRASLLGQLSGRVKAWDGGGGLVNLSYDPSLPLSPIQHAPFAVPPDLHTAFGGTLYRPSLPPLDLAPLSLAALPESVDHLLQTGRPLHGETHIYVCTHGTRDCRCGETGSAVFRALRSAAADRPGVRVRVREISHVGGHVWAANVITYPKGDWYGLVTPSDAPRLLETILDPAAGPWAEKWRGRSLPSTSSAFSPSPAALSPSSRTQPSSPAPTTPVPNPQLVPLTFQLSDSQLVQVDAAEGESLMQVGKREGLGAIEGVCGGQMECATCHVYLPSPFSHPHPASSASASASSSSSSTPPTNPGPPPINPITEDEEDELAYALNRIDGVSRLGCQIQVTRELGEWCARGERVGVPRY